MKRRSAHASKPATAADHTPEAPDLVSRAVDSVCGTLHAEIAFASWARVQPTGLSLVGQQFDIDWHQQLMQLYEIGSTLSFKISGRTQGEWAMRRVFGPGSPTRQFIATYSSGQAVCVPDLRIAPQDNLAYRQDMAARDWTMEMVKMASVGLQRETGNMLFLEQVAGQFSGLSLKKPGKHS